MYFVSLLQAAHTPESQRSYMLRKRSTPAPVTERTTFVCYTCGTDTPSSQLRLVYCCANTEREPYYPFIKTMKVFKNASPISPQGDLPCSTLKYEGKLIKFLYVFSRHGANLRRLQREAQQPGRGRPACTCHIGVRRHAIPGVQLGHVQRQRRDCWQSCDGICGSQFALGKVASQFGLNEQCALQGEQATAS